MNLEFLCFIGYNLYLRLAKIKASFIFTCKALTNTNVLFSTNIIIIEVQRAFLEIYELSFDKVISLCQSF